MRHFIETAQTEEDSEIFAAKAKEFHDFLKANQSKGYCGFMSMTSPAIDGEVSAIGTKSYTDFIYLILMLVARASAGSGKPMYEIWRDIFLAVQGDADGSMAANILKLYNKF